MKNVENVLGIDDSRLRASVEEALAAYDEDAEGGLAEYLSPIEPRDQIEPPIPASPYAHTDKLGRPPSPFNPSVPICGAKTRSGGICTRTPLLNAAGEYTRCRIHGGRSTGRPLKSGQYSKKAARRVLEVAEDLENDQGLTAVENNVKVLAALFLEKMAKLEEEGFEHLDDKEIARLYDMVDRLNKNIETRHRIREGQKYTVKIEHLQYIVVAVADAVNRVLADYPDLRTRLAKEIEGIKVVDG